MVLASAKAILSSAPKIRENADLADRIEQLERQRAGLRAVS